MEKSDNNTCTKPPGFEKFSNFQLSGVCKLINNQVDRQPDYGEWEFTAKHYETALPIVLGILSGSSNRLIPPGKSSFPLEIEKTKEWNNRRGSDENSIMYEVTTKYPEAIPVLKYSATLQNYKYTDRASPGEVMSWMSLCNCLEKNN
jgi:hypothetical protein